MLADYYLPGYKAGGPVRTISNMVEHLSDDFEFLIFTLDSDLNETTPYSGIKTNQWNNVGKAQVFYCSAERMSYRFIRRFLNNTEYDLLYLNSFVSFSTSLYPLLMYKLGQVEEKPVVLAPRGQFSAGALSIKAYRKIIYRNFFNLVGIWDKVLWQASSDYEVKDIRKVFSGQCRIFTAIDLPSLKKPQVIWCQKQPECLRVLFLSRIDPMKNLDYALKILARVKSRIQFTIIGPATNRAYWESCKQLFSLLGPNIELQYDGSIEHEKVVSAIARHDLLLFPTAGENYGHVILEALLAGTPVLTSDNTPWRDLQQAGVGWDLSLANPEKFVQAINEVCELSPEEHLDWRKKIQSWAIARQNNQSHIEQNKNLFLYALGCLGD